eukprot:218027-Pleurochrysis_carterae.AAC.1
MRVHAFSRVCARFVHRKTGAFSLSCAGVTQSTRLECTARAVDDCSLRAITRAEVKHGRRNAAHLAQPRERSQDTQTKIRVR